VTAIAKRPLKFMSVLCLLSVTAKKKKKIPVIELKFLYFQRKYGIGKIGAVDVKETKKKYPKIYKECG